MGEQAVFMGAFLSSLNWIFRAHEMYIYVFKCQPAQVGIEVFFGPDFL